nr:unnamed protein product [Callosobruchus analis]
MEERSAFEERFFAAQAFLAEIIGTESPNTHVQSLSDANMRKACSRDVNQKSVVPLSHPVRPEDVD